MAEKEGTRRRRRSTPTSAEKAATQARKKAEKDVGALDNPDVADEPSEIRHVAYFVAVLAGALALNLVAMVVVAGGQ